MRSTLSLPLLSALFALRCATAYAQQETVPPTRLIVVNSLVGDTISPQEKATYGLFPYYATDNFRYAYFTQQLAPDSALTLHTQLRDGRLVQRPFTSEEFITARFQIQNRARELGGGSQGAAPLVGLNAVTSTGNNPDLAVGSVYQVTLHNGTSFKGTLVSLTLTSADFDTPDLGRVTVQRADIKRYVALQVAKSGRVRDDVGNGNRLFFAPTARSLRKGEGYVQDIDIFLLGVNYGVTDHFSIGLLASAIPGIGLGKQVVALTPKLTTKVSAKWNVGVGALIARIPDFDYDNGSGFGAGIAYGLATYGTADDNLTMGLGYGFSGQGGFGRTPVVLLGGAKRITNRVSLVSENYLFVQGTGGVGGLYGIRLGWPRTTLNVGSFYVAPFEGGGAFGYVYPVYLDVALRFGQPKK
ncbi:hypothetical protein MUN82_18890 [Hymenobacter aerilatus]|uniref:Uncharacterized protein n=1 Tax=Hymenobacter aerilatus TaxID=2932251 RepID=A0A8T9SXS3_9BACT|nr:hypothetical protein [Hymenobacter aerilatus]UOR04990.1 hypothetical protein MUN82_18890 [Hymenobacter aerilatus]